MDDGVRRFGHLAMERAEWRTDGHAAIGARVARTFGKRHVTGTLVKWLPADVAAGEPALFRLVHDDGDEEDLEEGEVEAGRAAYAALPQRRTTRVSAAAHGATPA